MDATPSHSSPNGADAFSAWLFYGGRHSAQFAAAVAENGDALVADLAGFAHIVIGDDASTSLPTVAMFVRASGVALSIGRVKPGSQEAELVASFVEVVGGADASLTGLGVHEFDVICAFIESLVQQDVTARGLSGFSAAFAQYDERLGR